MVSAKNMAPRLPTPSDFPDHINVTVVPPSRPSPDEPLNVVIVLHGLGDTNVPFTAFARHMALPETTCVCVQAPHPLPLDLQGYHWGDDILFDDGTGALDMDAGLTRATSLLRDGIIGKGLVERCGYRRSDLILFGFGQGGMLAMALVASLPQEEALAGVVSIGGPLPSVTTPAADGKRKTPVLILGGSSATAVTAAATRKVRDTFERVDDVRWRKPGDGMPGSREEMQPIMRFLSERLQSRRGVPRGAVQVG